MKFAFIHSCTYRACTYSREMNIICHKPVEKNLNSYLYCSTSFQISTRD